MLLIRTLVLSFVVAASTLAAGSTASQAEPADPVAQGSALERSYARGNLHMIDIDLTPIHALSSSPYFWANWFNSSTGALGTGGYIGLQSLGDRRNGTRGKTALFAMWGANASTGPATSACLPFGNEGSGQSCMATFEWMPLHTYRLRVQKLRSDSRGQWWAGYVYDRVTSINTLIGKIRVPYRGGLGSSTSAFTEYFGPTLASCSAQPYSAVAWGPSSANKGAVRVVSSRHNLYGGNCLNARMTTSDNGVIQEGGTVGPYYAGEAQICGAIAAPTTFNGSPYWPLLFGARSWVRPPADPAASTNNWGLDWGGTVTVERKYQCPYGK